MGPPGCSRLENAGALAEYFQWKFISTGDALRKEAENKTPQGERIAACLTSFSYIDDDIVIEVVKKEIEEAEKANTSWIIEGFPRTRVQALALQKMGIVPDKFVHLGVSQAQSLSRLRANCAEVNQSLYGKELEDVGMSLYREWDVNQREVNNTFNKFIYFYDCNEKQQQDVANDLARMLRVRFRNGAPRRPPKVILLGPPGSGRTTQAELIAHRFGLVCVSPEMLVREEQERNPGVKLRV
jgi:adenylate kinase